MDAQAPQTTVHTNGTVHALLFLAFIVFVAVLEGLTFALYVLFAIPVLLHDVCTLVWGRLPFVDAIYHGITQQSGNWVKHDGGAYAARVAETIRRRDAEIAVLNEQIQEERGRGEHLDAVLTKYSAANGGGEDAER